MGIVLFAAAFCYLTVLPLTIEHFLASSDKLYKEFKDMITDLIATNKKDGRFYVAFGLISIFSLLCFIVVSWYIVLNAMLFY